MDFINALILGIVEGITEWLPISSTGHMILVNEFLKYQSPDMTPDFLSVFDVVIQLGAILAVVIIFWKKIWPFGKKDNKHPLSESGFGAVVKKDIFVMWFKILVACIPAVIVGLLFDDWLDEHFYNPWVVSIALIAFGIAFIVVENWNKHREPKVTKLSQLTYKHAAIIGLFQVLAAVFPGTSRSGATIIGALLIGISRTVAAEFTFFLAIPVMLGASLLKVLKFGFAFTQTQLIVLLIGAVVAFVISMFIIKFLMGYIRKHDFKIFGWYRIVLGVLVLAYFIIFSAPAIG